jgi:serine protease inhibitor
MPAGGVDDATRLVLVNALYFKAQWAQAFGDPSPKAFTLASGQKVSVPTLSGSMGTALAQGEGWQAASIPYVGSGLAMTLIRSDSDPVSRLGTILGALRPASVGVTFPAWQFTSDTPLTEVLQKAGMSAAFNGGFAPMTAPTPNQLQIGQVFHQCFIAVDKDGTEAAAATAVGMTASSARVDDADLVFDEPFCFVIHDTAHLTPLFVGRVADPR